MYFRAATIHILTLLDLPSSGDINSTENDANVAAIQQDEGFLCPFLTFLKMRSEDQRPIIC